mgnify:CR=1 FL=1
MEALADPGERAHCHRDWRRAALAGVALLLRPSVLGQFHPIFAANSFSLVSAHMDRALEGSSRSEPLQLGAIPRALAGTSSS